MTERTIHIVDDEDAVRRSAAFLLRTAGYAVTTHESGTAFLADCRHLAPGCVLLDVRMPGIDGLEVQRLLGERGIPMPVIILTGHGDIQTAVAAMKAGAVDFLEKPFARVRLLEAVDAALFRLDAAHSREAGADAARLRLAALTTRERDVLGGLARGLSNKMIAREFGISSRTVEVHRANLMAKLGAGSLSDVLRLTFAAESPSRGTIT